MREQMMLLELRRPKIRLELQRERRIRMLENIVNIFLGVGSVAAAFWGGWLVGSGAIL